MVTVSTWPFGDGTLHEAYLDRTNTFCTCFHVRGPAIYANVEPAFLIVRTRVLRLCPT